MMKLLDVIIHLRYTREVGCPDILSGKIPFKKIFGSSKHKFPKRKYKVREEPEGILSGKPITPKSQVKRPKYVDTKDATKK